MGRAAPPYDEYSFSGIVAEACVPEGSQASKKNTKRG